jgi:hypothetical protein
VVAAATPTDTKKKSRRKKKKKAPVEPVVPVPPRVDALPPPVVLVAEAPPPPPPERGWDIIAEFGTAMRARVLQFLHTPPKSSAEVYAEKSSEISAEISADSRQPAKPHAKQQQQQPPAHRLPTPPRYLAFFAAADAFFDAVDAGRSTRNAWSLISRFVLVGSGAQTYSSDDGRVNHRLNTIGKESFEI